MTESQFSTYYRDDVVQIGKTAKKVPVDHDKINALKTQGSFVDALAATFRTREINNVIK